MHTRIAMITVSLAVPILVFVACNDGQPAPTDAPMPVASPSPTAEPAVESINMPTSVPTQTSALAPALTSELSDLTDETSPCTPVPKTSTNPCESDAPMFETGGALYQPELGDEPRSLRKMIDGDTLPPALVTHLVLRGTYLPGTVRCTAGNPFSPPSYLRDELGDTSNERSIKCYVDVRANSFLLGSGPATLTTMLFGRIYWDQEYTSDLEDGQTEQDLIEADRQRFETAVEGFFPGREHVIFLGPSIDLSSEVWQFMGYWDVQRRDNGTVIAVHPHRSLWASTSPDDYQTHVSALEMELPAFTQAVTTAHQARVTEYEGRIGADADLPMLVSNVNQLRQYYTEVGAYASGVPVPAQPPPPCGLAVPDQADNPGLMRDCFNLLAAKDTLRGTATLNWSVDTAITSWDGVRVEGSPGRVTRLLLTSNNLTGTIPPDLARLDALEYLWLNYNQLTGEIPAALGSIASLKSLILNNNQLTGEVPEELGDLASLEALWLNKNRLSGEIPSELADLINLRNLLLSDNRLSGEVPPEPGDLASLETLWLGGNQLTGEIPSELGGLTNLQDLSLLRNGLTGEVPAELGNLANLNRLRLARNQLTGCIPPALRNVDDHDLDRLGLQDCATP